MLCMDVFFQSTCFRKCFATRYTIVNFLSLMTMNCITYVCSNSQHDKMVYHTFYICDLCDVHELYECVVLNDFPDKMIYHKNHIWNLFCLHELNGYVSFYVEQ